MAVMLRNLRSLLLLAGMTLLGLPLTAQSGTPLPVIPEPQRVLAPTNPVWNRKMRCGRTT